MELLIIEDEAKLGRALEQGLTENRHACSWARNGRGGLELALTGKFDAVVLDLMLPDMGGLDVLRSLRADGVRTPVLILTALGSVEERVAGLKAGADDYLVKPFAFPELLARLEAIARRSAPRPSPVLDVAGLTLDLSSRRVTRDGDEIDLSPTEFSMLELLMRHAGQVVTRRMLSEHIWGDDWGGMTNAIDVHINRLRRKVDRGFDHQVIHTVRGHGYVLRSG
jgi:two-component system OmpR family response regulator/two-component system copper resistance phosphate regulon response regulator CusR